MCKIFRDTANGKKCSIFPLEISVINLYAFLSISLGRKETTNLSFSLILILIVLHWQVCTCIFCTTALICTMYLYQNDIELRSHHYFKMNLSENFFSYLIVLVLVSNTKIQTHLCSKAHCNHIWDLIMCFEKVCMYSLFQLN